MSISPHHYRDVLNDTQTLTNEVNAYLQGKTTDGVILPIRFNEAIDTMIKRCSEEIGRLNLLYKGLGTFSKKRDEYMNAINNVKKCQMELENLRKAIDEWRLKKYPLL